MTFVEIVGDTIVHLLLPLLLLLAFPFGIFASSGQFVALVAVVIHGVFVPHFPAVVRVAGSVIVDDKVILIETVPDDLLVSFVVNFFVDVVLFLCLPGRTALLPGRAESF
jgi:hypothetical protein